MPGEDGYPYGIPMNHWYNPEDGKLYYRENVYLYERYPQRLGRMYGGGGDFTTDIKDAAAPSFFLL